MVNKQIAIFSFENYITILHFTQINHATFNLINHNANKKLVTFSFSLWKLPNNFYLFLIFSYMKPNNQVDIYSLSAT